MQSVAFHCYAECNFWLVSHFLVMLSVALPSVIYAFDCCYSDCHYVWYNDFFCHLSKARL